MQVFSEDFMNAEVTISRKELGMIIADSIVEICDDFEPEDEIEAKAIVAVEELLKRFGAVILSEVFKEDTLEVEE